MTIAVSVEFSDHSSEIMSLLERKLRAAVGAVAEQLADDYKTELQKDRSPPHSKKGQIPHAYLGHRPGGFGPVNGFGEINNTVSHGFSRDQTDFLATYITGVAGAEGQFIRGLVGFADSHVTRRSQNYLLFHDRTKRPWVKPLYKKYRRQLVQAAKSNFEGTR